MISAAFVPSRGIFHPVCSSEHTTACPPANAVRLENCLSFVACSPVGATRSRSCFEDDWVRARLALFLGSLRAPSWIGEVLELTEPLDDLGDAVFNLCVEHRSLRHVSEKFGAGPNADDTETRRLDLGACPINSRPEPPLEMRRLTACPGFLLKPSRHDRAVPIAFDDDLIHTLKLW